MCGRFGLDLDMTHLLEFYHATLSYDEVFRLPNWNCAPTQQLPIIRQEAIGRVVDSSRWGWRRPFTKAPLINARADHILTTTKTFRKALAERRCVVPASHFYEWQVIDSKTKQPYAIGLKNAPLFAMAGLWEDETQDGITERCHLVCTIEPNKLMLSIHDRQPLILTNQEQVDRWLNPESTMPEIVDLIKTTPPELMHAWKVGKDVGNVKNNGPELVKPV